MQNLISQHRDVIEAQLPEIAEELKGLAEGAGISYENAILLQQRVELIGNNEEFNLEGDCSTVGLHRLPDQIITGQTIDLPGDMKELIHVFRIIPESDGKPEILMCGFAGLLGYIGLNSFGLSININLVLSDDWQAGISPYLLVRHFLTLTTKEQCLNELKRLRRSSSRNFLISDREGMLNIECTARNISTTHGDCLVHTNHYLTDLKQQETMNFLFRNSSIKRLQLVEKLLPDISRQITPEQLFTIFSDHSLYPVGICAHAEGNVRRSETVGAVVMQPSINTLHVRKGNPCKTTTKTFRLHSANV